MKCFLKICAWIIATVNSVASIVLLCVICPRLISHEQLEFDYIGIVVAIFALLITLLVGWNIYSALELKKDLLSKVDNLRSEYNEKLKEHSILNEREFNNILTAMKRSENFCNKLDESLLELLKIHFPNNENK